MSVASGMNHAKDIENLRNLISEYFQKHGQIVSWEHLEPYKRGTSFVWSHNFQLGVVVRNVLFVEDLSGRLRVYIADQVVAEIGSNSRFGASDLHDILSGLRG